tara:strand:- start:1489 stop:2088 length:600 start_codon:yes stop_codon:yes gene_type:complete
MARTKNQESYKQSLSHLLNVGLKLIRSGSFQSVGINDILEAAAVPKGSFYHYFKNKEAFGIAVAEHYHAQQMEFARSLLGDKTLPPIERLQKFFEAIYNDLGTRNFEQGCLMCNLSVEMADENTAFQQVLQSQWSELSALISNTLTGVDMSVMGLTHLQDHEAGDWLLNSWSGALNRMKATGNGAPLKLFMKSVFGKEL